MAITYEIRSFDPATSEMWVEYSDGSRGGFGIPVIDGNYLSGEALHDYIMHMKPPRIVSGGNADELLALVKPGQGQPRRFSKKRLFEAMTDVEYDKWEKAELQQNKRKRRMVEEAVELRENDAAFPELRAVMVAVYGEPRTVELLKAASF